MADQPRIFVSYSHKDEDFTQHLVADLHQAGAEVWVDVSGIMHGNFLQRVDEALLQCQWMVLILTPSAIASLYVKDEVYTALHRVKQGHMSDVIPVLAAPCAPGTIPPQWDTLHRYDATHDYASAVAGVLRAVGLSPATSKSTHADYVDDLVARGNVMAGQGKLAEALLLLERATQLVPGSSDAWAWDSLGHVLSRLGRYQEELAAREQALAIEPASAYTWCAKGNVLFRLNRYEEALAAFERAISLNPEYTFAWRKRASTLRALGRAVEAEAAEKHAKELGGNG